MQQRLKLNMVEGLQTQSMKAKWDKEISDSCPICGQSDTREHRLLDCVASQKAREQFPNAQEILQCTRPEWVYMPFPRQHEMNLLLRAYTQTVKPPIIPSTLYECGHTLRFFTDGGAIHPACAAARIATWAVGSSTGCCLDRRTSEERI
jgi:hypothetical protein